MHSVLVLMIVVLSTILCQICRINANQPINEWAVHVRGGVSAAKAVARRLGFVYVEKLDALDDIHIMKRPETIHHHHHHHTKRLKSQSEVHWAEQQVVKFRARRDASSGKLLVFDDPEFTNQWYLNRASKGAGADMNIQEAWSLGYTGKGTVSSILDDGIDYTHPDLKQNYDKQASTDLNDKDNDPMPNKLQPQFNKHGTRCAGVIAAWSNNSNCIVGVAYQGGIGGVRMLDGDVTDRVEAAALGLRQWHINIYSGSWGPEDNGVTIEGPGTLAAAALKKGVSQGRNGLGNIFVWASGNGGKYSDSCACDGYASSMYTLSVGSVSERNKKPWYLEECASTIASTYSSGSPDEKQIVTTDLHNECTKRHSGTSASAPLAAGMVALMLEANPKLTWRDVQYITIATANPRPILDGNFITNAVGRKVSLAYGYGLMDGGKMVRLAELWLSLPTQLTCRVKSQDYVQRLSKKFKHKFKVSTSSCSQSSHSNIRYLEHVQLYVKLNFGLWGDIEIALISPSGTRSVMLPRRPRDTKSGTMPLNHLPLMSVQFWGERAEGDWYVEVSNTVQSSQYRTGIFQYAEIHIHGTKEQPIRLRKPKLNRMPPKAWFSQFSKYVVNSSLITDNGVIECDEECFNETSCTKPGPVNCFSCKHYRDISNVCVSQCPFGQYPADSSPTQSCLACHQNCAACIGAGPHNCTACPPTLPLLFHDKKTCVTAGNCPDGYYRVDNVCYRCLAPCIKCESKDRCLRCDKGFVVKLSKRCGNSCEPASFVDYGGVCQPCHHRCSSCAGGSNVSCTACKPGYHIVKASARDTIGMCTNNCPAHHYLDKNTQTCKRCHYDCANCTGPGQTHCTDCRPPLILSKMNRCVERTCTGQKSCPCKLGEYSDSSKKPPVCSKCHESCRTCNGPTQKDCTSCLNYELCVWPSPSTNQRVYGTCRPCCYNTGMWNGHNKGPNDTSNCGLCLPPSTNVCWDPYDYQKYLYSKDPKLPKGGLLGGYQWSTLVIVTVIALFCLFCVVFACHQLRFYRASKQHNSKKKTAKLFSDNFSYIPLKSHDSSDEEEHDLFVRTTSVTNGAPPNLLNGTVVET